MAISVGLTVTGTQPVAVPDTSILNDVVVLLGLVAVGGALGGLAAAIGNRL